jgi:hypothetical protein
MARIHRLSAASVKAIKCMGVGSSPPTIPIPAPKSNSSIKILTPWAARDSRQLPRRTTVFSDFHKRPSLGRTQRYLPGQRLLDDLSSSGQEQPIPQPFKTVPPRQRCYVEAQEK